MTQDKRRILNAARHADIYKPSLMKAKSLDFLEVFLLQSRCRLHELYATLNKYVVGAPLSKEDQEMYWAFQQDLAELQSDITTLILIKDQLSNICEFQKAGKEITAETVAIYLEQAKEEEANCEQDPNDDIRSKLEKLL